MQAPRPGVHRRFGRLIIELSQDKAGAFGLAVMVVVALAAIFAPVLAPHDPTAQSLDLRLQPPFWLEGGDISYPLGTDYLGRDVLSRLIFGSRTSLFIAVSVVLIAGTIGAIAGVVAGYLGGRVDALIMRWVDLQLSFPELLLALVILAVIGPSARSVILVLSITGWLIFARTSRAVAVRVREEEYVQAARVTGCKPSRVMMKHVLPNMMAPLFTVAVLEWANVIMAEAALSYLGLGIQPPQSSWGLEVANGQDYIFSGWWLITFPGAAIALTVLSLNLFAGWISVVGDPQEREKRYAEASGAMKPGAAMI